MSKLVRFGPQIDLLLLGLASITSCTTPVSCLGGFPNDLGEGENILENLQEFSR